MRMLCPRRFISVESVNLGIELQKIALNLTMKWFGMKNSFEMSFDLSVLPSCIFRRKAFLPSSSSCPNQLTFAFIFAAELQNYSYLHKKFHSLSQLEEIIFEIPFFDREQCSKFLKEDSLLFFVFFFLAWNQVQKMFQKDQKMFANKICLNLTKKLNFANNIFPKSNKKCYKSIKKRYKSNKNDRE